MPASQPTSNPLTIIQLSDFHLLSSVGMSPGDLFSKRLYGRLAWQRRGREMESGILAAMVADIRRQNPDLVVVTGDLTHLGQREEYLEARRLLEGLGGPEQVLVIPGNHDAYVPGAWENNFQLLGPYLAGDGPGPTAESPVYPVVRFYGEVAVIGLNSAGPRPLWLATGSLGPAQLARLDEKLECCGRHSQARVVLVHHPPIPGVAGWRRRLSDEDAFLRVIAARGAELVLYGHIHRRRGIFLEVGDVPVPCFGVPAAAALGRSPSRRARYNIYRLFQTPEKRWRLDYVIRRWSVSDAEFRDEIYGGYGYPGMSLQVSGV